LKIAVLSLFRASPIFFSVIFAAGNDLASAIPAPTNFQAFEQLRSIVVKSSVTEGGLTGISTRIEDLQAGKYREEFTLGIDRGAEGFDGKIAWSQDAGDRVRREEGDFEKAAASNRAYRGCMAYWFPDRFLAKIQSLGQRAEAGHNYDVYAVEPAGGQPSELWFDAGTHLLVRLVEPGFYRTSTSRFSNFKPVHGILFPFSVRTSKGDPRFDRVENVQEIQIDPRFDSSLFAEPKEGGPDYALNAAYPVTIPFRPAVNLIIVEASVNGKTLPFILDTGAVNILFPETVAALGLSPEGHLSGFGGGQDEFTISQVRIASLVFASARYQPQKFLVYPFPELPKVTGIPQLAGILGYEIFKRFVVRVDYPRHELTLSLPDAFHFSGDGLTIPFHFVGNGLEVDGTVDSTSGKFIVDTGNTGSLILYSPWVSRHRGQFSAALAKTYTATGAAGGAAAFSFAIIKHLTLGSASFRDVPGALSLQTSGATANPYGTGIVGAELFLKSAITFDYQRRSIILEQSPR
jgi:hypothetical protein